MQKIKGFNLGEDIPKGSVFLYTKTENVGGSYGANIPIFYFLVPEGELLEGGTVEKSTGAPCQSFFHEACTYKGCVCPCHNKKETTIKTNAPSYHLELTDFNRETPKRCPTCGHTKEMGKVSRCNSAFHRETLTEEELDKSIELLVKEEVQLPEMLDMNDIEDKNFVADLLIAQKINEILTYLASKEKK